MQYSKFISYKNKALNSMGFSLVEVIVTIAIAGIALSIALPNLSTFLVQLRVDNEVSEMQRLLLTARNNAINTGLNTTVCPLDSSNQCTNNWEKDISVFSNSTATNTTFDGTDILIKVKSATQDGDVFKISTNAAIVYTPTGRSLSGNANVLTFCPSGNASAANGIDISTSGRSYIGTENASGTFVDRGGNTFTCS